jgi:hypothetical protein
MHLHSRRTVHLTPALLHLQFLVHDFMHPRCSRMEQALLLSSRAVQYGNHLPLLSVPAPLLEVRGVHLDWSSLTPDSGLHYRSTDMVIESCLCW